MISCGVIQCRLVVRVRVEDAKNVQEQVEDVEVQLDGGRNLVFGVELVHDHLGVHNDEHAEQHNTNEGVGEVQSRGVREQSDEPETNQCQQEH